MLYQHQAKQLAESLNQEWQALSRLAEDDRLEALTALCHDILMYGSSGLSTPFPFRDLRVRRIVEGKEPRFIEDPPPASPPINPPKPPIKPAHRDPNKPWEISEGDPGAGG